MIAAAADRLVYGVFGLSTASKSAQALHFFIYDSVKILLLLYVMILIIGVVRTYVPAGRVRMWMAGRHRIVTYLAAACFGALTPFCSCSSIPIFISFIAAGVPLGAAFAFLVTSPLLNEYLAILMFGYFGAKITLAYILFGLALGIAAGAIADAMRWERHLAADLTAQDANNHTTSYASFSSRLRYGQSEAGDIVKKLWVWVLAGVGIGALIHGFVPEAWIHGALEATGVFSVPLATLLGVPVYANCVAVVPIAVVLFEKGLPLGTALAFMMATASLSLPEAVILRRAMDIRLIIIFFGLVALGIVAIGYAFNWLATVLV